jgi:TonB family protein
MKVLFTILCMTNLICFGQNYIRQQQASDIALFNLYDLEVTPEKSFDFFDHYGIDLNEYSLYMTLEDVPVRSKPEFNSGHYDAYIPAGSGIKVYKYFPAQDFYVVQHKEFWGFIPATTVKLIPEPKKKLHISEVDTPPVLKTSPELHYPAIASAREIEGTVLIRIYIGTAGDVTNAEVIDGIIELNAEALNFARGLYFKPAMINGNPVEVFANFPVKFTLPEKE